MQVSPELESRARETLGQTTTRPAGLQGCPRGPSETCCGSSIVAVDLAVDGEVLAPVDFALDDDAPAGETTVERLRAIGMLG